MAETQTTEQLESSPSVREAVVSDVLSESADLIDAIFAYIVAEFPQMRERAAELQDLTRREFSGDMTYIARRSPVERQRVADEVLSLFNGRNASEVARRLNISRAGVYRIIKTGGGRK